MMCLEDHLSTAVSVNGRVKTTLYPTVNNGKMSLKNAATDDAISSNIINYYYHVLTLR